MPAGTAGQEDRDKQRALNLTAKWAPLLLGTVSLNLYATSIREIFLFLFLKRENRCSENVPGHLLLKEGYQADLT